MWDNAEGKLWVSGQQPGFISVWTSSTQTWELTLPTLSGLVAPPTDMALSLSGDKIYFAGSTLCNFGAFEYRKTGTNGVTSFGKRFNGPVNSLELDINGNLLYAGGGFNSSGSNIASFDIVSRAWNAIGSSSINGQVYAVTSDPTRIFIGIF